MAGDKMRCASAHAEALRRGARGGDQGGMIREAKIVVACERDQFAPVDDDARALRRFDDATSTRKSRCGAVGEIALERTDE